jgi:hypothetical protein
VQAVAQVAASGEERSRPGQHPDPQARVVVELAERRVEPAGHLAVHGVALLGALEPGDQHAAAALSPDRQAAPPDALRLPYQPR